MGLAVSVALVALVSGASAAVGVLTGGLWNLLSLWALTQLLSVWLGPDRSNRKVVAWVLIKFPLLYVLAFALLQVRFISSVGFAAGFSIVLIIAIATFAVNAIRMNASLTSRE